MRSRLLNYLQTCMQFVWFNLKHWKFLIAFRVISQIKIGNECDEQKKDCDFFVFVFADSSLAFFLPLHIKMNVRDYRFFYSWTRSTILKHSLHPKNAPTCRRNLISVMIFFLVWWSSVRICINGTIRQWLERDFLNERH